MTNQVATRPVVTITDAQKRQYEQEGYFVIERVVPEDHLETLRNECQRFIDLADAEMDRLGVDSCGLNHRGSRYFVSQMAHQSDRVWQVTFSALMADICRALLGDTAFLFNDQYVVKCAEKGVHFSWHQDSGYIAHDHRPYLSCWFALDDVDEENGTVYILPYSLAGTRQRIEHVKDPALNDLVGYTGSEQGAPVIAPAGSIAVFSSVAFHRSGANMTCRPRRVYLAQYSAEPILKADGSEPWRHADPFIEAGKVVASSQR